MHRKHAGAKPTEVRRLVEAYLDSIPKGRGIVIAGYGSFTAEELRDEVRRGTPAGNNIKRAVLRYKHLKEGRERRKSQKPSALVVGASDR